MHQSSETEDDLYDPPKVKNTLGSSFRTFDATDYSLISTVDIKKNIYDLCADNTDNYLAVIEVRLFPPPLFSTLRPISHLYSELS